MGIKSFSRDAIGWLESHRYLDKVSDKTYLRLMYWCRMGKWLNLKNPRTFNEKLQWLKLNDRNELYPKLVDKFVVKDYVAKIIGTEFIIPTIGVWDRFDDIDFDQLPDQFVLKCTHDSGGLVICTNKSKLDMQSAKTKIERSLRSNYFYQGREWPYKTVQPRIIAEKYLVDESGYELKDYKFFCFDGVPKIMFIASDRQVEGEDTKFDFYDMNFEHLPFTNGHPNANRVINKPKSFDKMKQLAALVSVGIPQARIDFYDINGDIYFGEITLFHWSGMVAFEPEEWDYKLGELISLPEKK